MISCSAFPWCPRTLAMVSSHWISGSAFWALGPPDALPLTWLWTPNFILTLGFLAPLPSGPATSSMLYFQSCLFFLPFHLIAFTVHVEKKYFVSWGKNELSKYQLIELRKIIFVKLQFIDEEFGPKRFSEVSQFAERVSGWVKCRTQLFCSPLCNYAVIYFFLNS